MVRRLPRCFSSFHGLPDSNLLVVSVPPAGVAQIDCILSALDTIQIHIMNGASETIYSDLMSAIDIIDDALWDIHMKYIEPCLRNTE